jgi:hypothetical protein
MKEELAERFFRQEVKTSISEALTKGFVFNFNV